MNEFERRQLETAEQYNNLLIGYRNNAPIYLKDVARVVKSVEDERISRNFWARDYGEAPAEVVLAVIFALPRLRIAR